MLRNSSAGIHVKNSSLRPCGVHNAGTLALSRMVQANRHEMRQEPRPELSSSTSHANFLALSFRICKMGFIISTPFLPASVQHPSRAGGRTAGEQTAGKQKQMSAYLRTMKRTQPHGGLGGRPQGCRDQRRLLSLRMARGMSPGQRA